MRELIIYQSEAGQAQVQFQAMDGNVWINQQEMAELRNKDRQPLTLDYWHQNVDRLLSFNDKPILQGSDKLRNERSK